MEGGLVVILWPRAPQPRSASTSHLLVSTCLKNIDTPFRLPFLAGTQNYPHLSFDNTICVMWPRDLPYPSWSSLGCRWQLVALPSCLSVRLWEILMNSQRPENNPASSSALCNAWICTAVHSNNCPAAKFCSRTVADENVLVFDGDTVLSRRCFLSVGLAGVLRANVLLVGVRINSTNH